MSDNLKSYEEEVRLNQFFLQELYDKFCYTDDKEKLKQARKLLSEIGRVDFGIEGYNSIDNQRDLSIKFHWGHDHKFNESLQIDGRMGDRHINLMAQFMTKYELPHSFFRGKDVLDVGCWTGGTTLLLKALGAERIVALEEVKKYQDAAQTLITDIYAQKNVNCEGGNLYFFEDDNKFDIIYFPGVVYHLSDPVLALRRLFNAAKLGATILVESMGIDREGPVCEFHGNKKFSQGTQQDLNRGGWNWFVPSPTCLSRWMAEAGFTGVSCFYSHVSKRVFGYGKKTENFEITRAGLSVPDID